MSTITVSVPDDVAASFRRASTRAFGGGKGHLGKAVTEALSSWAERVERGEVARRQLALLGTGLHLGGVTYASREELHER